MFKKLMAGVTARSFWRACLYFFIAGIIAVFLRHSIVGLLSIPAFFTVGADEKLKLLTPYFMAVIPFAIFIIVIGSRGWFTAIAVKNQVPFLRRIGIRVLTTVCVAISLANFSTLLYAVPSSAVAAMTPGQAERVVPPARQQQEPMPAGANDGKIRD